MILKKPQLLEKITMANEPVQQPHKEALEAAIARFEGELKRIENKETNDTTRTLIAELNEVTTALATIQDMLNLVWKRTEQMHEQLHSLRQKTE